MAANQMEMSLKIGQFLSTSFAEMGLALDSFVVENLSLPDELQKRLDERISMNMIGDMGKYTQYQVAQSIPIAAANESGIAGVGAGLAAGFGMAGQMTAAMGAAMQPPQPPQAPPPAAPQGGTPPVAPAGGAGVTATADLKFCSECGQRIPRASKFCPECGKPQG